MGISRLRARGHGAALLTVIALCAFVWLGGCAVGVESAGVSSSPQPGVSPGGPAPSASDTPSSGLPRVAVGDLPSEARDVLDTIARGGPYEYPQDDQVFFNREGRLPDRDRGYYREYTVRTPGESDRGARRLVVGRDGDVYYTSDHYRTFRQVRL
ncbi:MAG: hypothetical protein GEU94_16480 [Micromonosporaceae bacterium]|nr:hypothetical protein [Micromonosporaceae bacterium]